jgi:hypothetical protein
MAAKDKARAAAELAAWQKTQPLHVKRPMNAYMFYSKKLRETKSADQSATAFMSQAGASWKKATPIERAPFEALAANAKAQYAAATAKAAM